MAQETHEPREVQAVHAIRVGDLLLAYRGLVLKHQSTRLPNLPSYHEHRSIQLLARLQVLFRPAWSYHGPRVRWRQEGGLEGRLVGQVLQKDRSVVFTQARLYRH